MEYDYTGVVVGYGSIGKRHSQVLSKILSTIVIIDKNLEARKLAAEAFPNALTFKSIKEAEKSGKINWKQVCAIIATWGPTHYEIFNDLADNGVKSILCEKPMSTSINKAFQMKVRAEKENIILNVNHYIRYSNFKNKLNEFIEEHNFGAPTLIHVGGGAACLATNGIHWIDLAIQLFDSFPQKVYSTASDDKINPRSKNLGFYGGSCIWSFDDNREALISFTNKSSIAAKCQIYFRNSVVEFGDDLSIIVFNRDMAAIEQYPAVTRTGPAKNLLFEGRLEGVNDFMASMQNAHLKQLHKSTKLSNAAIGYRSVMAILAAFTSSKKNQVIQLPVDPESRIAMQDWPIS